MRHISIILSVVFLLASCGTKKNAVQQDTQTTSEQNISLLPEVPVILTGMTKTIADTAQSVRPTMGLLWQENTLLISLSQGRRLAKAHTATDTLYLYEAPCDTTDFATRQYAINIPADELIIIKYNDSLVYPLMPTAEQCMYPLEIKSMGAKVLKAYREKVLLEEAEKKKSPYRFGVLDASSLPLELWDGTYFYNAGAYQLGRDCECKTDSSNVLVLHVDGTWQRYENKILKNCGIMRKGGNPDGYEMDNYNHKTVIFLDTASIAGHIIHMKEDKRRWQENVPYQYNEYRWVGKGKIGLSFMFVRAYPLQEDSIMRYYFFIPGWTRRFFYEGSRCGWQGEIRDVEM